MGKARVGVRLKEAVGGKKSLNRSEDLEQLTQRYDIFCTKLHALIKALKAQYGAMHHAIKTRLEVAAHIANLATGTPLMDYAGQYKHNNGGEQQEQINVKTTSSNNNYYTTHQGFANKSNMYTSKYAQHVIDYAVQWEKVVTSRISAGLKKAEELRIETDHYQEKVEALRATANTSLAKGKAVDSKTADKLTRNESKLNNVKSDYNKFTSNLCTLIEEVTERSWRDLHPLLVKIAQFDFTFADDEQKTLQPLTTIVNELKRFAVVHGIKAQSRLKDIDTLDPTKLSTKHIDENTTAANTASIESGFSGLSVGGGGGNVSNGGGSSNDPFGNDNFAQQQQQPGGFPVPVSSNAMTTTTIATTSISRSSSFESSHSGASNPVTAPSTLDMMAISASAAPPPTLDQVNAAVGTTSRSAPNSGNGSLPPRAQRGRNYSIDSQDSGSHYSNYSGASAPPPASAPPLPPGVATLPLSSTSATTRPGGPNIKTASSFGSQDSLGSSGIGLAPNSYGVPPQQQTTMPLYPSSNATFSNNNNNTNPFGGGGPTPPPLNPGPNPFGHGPLPTATAAGGGNTNPFGHGPPPSASSYNPPSMMNTTTTSNTNPFGATAPSPYPQQQYVPPPQTQQPYVPPQSQQYPPQRQQQQHYHPQTMMPPNNRGVQSTNPFD